LTHMTDNGEHGTPSEHEPVQTGDKNDGDAAKVD